MRGCKLPYLNLRGATVRDLILEQCQIGTLDLGQARVQRFSGEGCQIDIVDVRQAHLRDVDLRGAQLATIQGFAHLRGAVITSEQLFTLAPVLASQAGLIVVG